MNLDIPTQLTGEQARIALLLLENLVDALIELHTKMEALYEPWGEELYREKPVFGTLEEFLGLITRPVQESSVSDDH